MPSFWSSNRLRRRIVERRISRAAKVPTTKENVPQRVRNEMERAHAKMEQSYHTPRARSTMENQADNIEVAKNRFAFLQAFRAAGIFGNETRNEIAHMRSFEEIEQRLGPKRYAIFRRVFQDAHNAAIEAEKEEYTKKRKSLRKAA